MAKSNSRESSQKTFLNFLNGVFVEKCESNTEGAKKRINKEQKEVYELHYDTISGILKKIEYHAREWNGQILQSWNVYLQDVDETIVVQLPFSSRATNSFLVRLPNIKKLDAYIELKAYYFQKEDKSIIVINQNGQKIEPFWTKENPGKLPQMEKMIVKNKEVWDDTKMMKFLRNYVENFFMPSLIEAQKATEIPQSQDDFSEETDDNLPF